MLNLKKVAYMFSCNVHVTMFYVGYFNQKKVHFLFFWYLVNSLRFCNIFTELFYRITMGMSPQHDVTRKLPYSLTTHWSYSWKSPIGTTTQAVLLSQVVLQWTILCMYTHNLIGWSINGLWFYLEEKCCTNGLKDNTAELMCVQLIMLDCDLIKFWSITHDHFSGFIG